MKYLLSLSKRLVSLGPYAVPISDFQNMSFGSIRMLQLTHHYLGKGPNYLYRSVCAAARNLHRKDAIGLSDNAFENLVPPSRTHYRPYNAAGTPQ